MYIRLAGDPFGEGVVSQLGGQGSKICVQSSKPKEHESLCRGTKPGRPVTGVTRTEFHVLHLLCAFPAPPLGTSGNHVLSP